MRKIASIVLSIVLMTGFVLPVSAAGFTDLNRQGTLTLMMEWDGEQLDSGYLTLYRVGDIVSVAGDDFFTPVSELEDSGISLTELENTQLPKELETLALREKLSPIRTSIQNGEAVFNALQTGLYLVTQAEEDACVGFSPIQPFLISLPHWNGHHYVYERKAQPKVELEIVPTEPTEPSEPKPTKPAEPTLPQTGQLNWPVPVMAVCGVMLIFAGILLCTGKKVDRED